MKLLKVIKNLFIAMNTFEYLNAANCMMKIFNTVFITTG